MNTSACFATLLAPLAVVAVGCRSEVAQPPGPAVSLAASNPGASAPAADTGPITVQWEELEIPLGPEQDFEPWMINSAIKSLAVRQVRITGYMHPGVAQRSNIREFVLVKHEGCQFGAEGQPQHVVMVRLQGKLRASLTAEAVTLTGTFAVDPYTGPDGRTWALYRLEATSFEEGMR